MIRLTALIAAILGLIIQPLMAGTLAVTQDVGVEAVMAFDSFASVSVGVSVSESAQHQHDRGAMPTAIPDTIRVSIEAQASCHEHESNGEESLADNCVCSDVDCMNSGICSSGGGAVQNNKQFVSLKPNHTKSINRSTIQSDSGFLSRIYHPPKLS